MDSTEWIAKIIVGVAVVFLVCKWLLPGFKKKNCCKSGCDLTPPKK